jgi:hypothetical protein
MLMSQVRWNRRAKLGRKRQISRVRQVLVCVWSSSKLRSNFCKFWWNGPVLINVESFACRWCWRYEFMGCSAALTASWAVEFLLAVSSAMRFVKWSAQSRCWNVLKELCITSHWPSLTNRVCFTCLQLVKIDLPVLTYC